MIYSDDDVDTSGEEKQQKGESKQRPERAEALQNAEDSQDMANHIAINDEDHENSDAQFEMTSDTDSSFSHIIEKAVADKKSIKYKHDSGSQASDSEPLKMLTSLNPDFNETFGSLDYFSHLVKEHQSQYRDVKSDQRQMPTAFKQQLSFMAGISLDHMLWELKSEYADIESKGTTDHEQLGRIRDLLVKLGQILGEPVNDFSELFQRSNRDNLIDNSLEDD